MHEETDQARLEEDRRDGGHRTGESGLAPGAGP